MDNKFDSSPPERQECCGKSGVLYEYMMTPVAGDFGINLVKAQHVTYRAQLVAAEIDSGAEIRAAVESRIGDMIMSGKFHHV